MSAESTFVFSFPGNNRNEIPYLWQPHSNHQWFRLWRQNEIQRLCQTLRTAFLTEEIPRKESSRCTTTWIHCSSQKGFGSVRKRKGVQQRNMTLKKINLTRDRQIRLKSLENNRPVWCKRKKSETPNHIDNRCSNDFCQSKLTTGKPSEVGFLSSWVKNILPFQLDFVSCSFSLYIILQTVFGNKEETMAVNCLAVFKTTFWHHSAQKL